MVTCVLPALFVVCASAARAETSREYSIKAGCLLNFARFTEWPAEAFADKASPIVIGILGTDPFGKVLDEIVRDESVRGRRLVVKRYERVEEIETCHILYLGQSEGDRLEATLAALKEKPVLTVSDIEGAAVRGVMIRLVNEQNRIRFRINLDSAKAARVTLSSKLLRAADIVPTEKK